MLLERDGELNRLLGLLDRALAGDGHLVFIGGQAGVGKTALADALIRRVRRERPEIVVRRGTCDDLTTPAALGPILEALPEIDATLDEGPVDRVALFRRIRAMLTTGPHLLVLDDVHWADEASLDLLRFLGRRISDVPALLIATYREEALEPGHPLAVTRGDLASASQVVRLNLGPLTVDAVRILVAESGSPQDADELFTRTGGNAFYVTEVLAGAGADLPDSVRDAVLARVSRLSPDARRVLEAAAVLGQPASLGLLDAVAERSPSAVDECVTSGLLVGIAGDWDFRHALARQAVAEATLPSARDALHRAALRTLAGIEGTEDRRLAFHAAACGDDDAVRRYAPLAAARAGRLGAHREAADLYRSALRVQTTRDWRRYELFTELIYECYLTGQPEAALAACHQALDLATDAEARGSTERWISRLSWFNGRADDALRYAVRSIETLEPLGPGSELAMAYSNRAQLAMLAGDVEGTTLWGDRALALARQLGDRTAESHALNNLGTVMANYGDYLEGMRHLQQSLDLAVAFNLVEHAARAHTNLGAAAALVRRLPEADRNLRAGITYCSERDLDSWEQYMRAWLARVLAEQGHLSDAARHAQQLLVRPQLAAIVRIPASVVAGQVAARRGHPVGTLLADASSLAEDTREAQRLVPAASALAELAWLEGRTAEIPALVESAWAAAAERPMPWELGELAWWLSVAGDRRPSPVEPAEPFRAMVAGDWAAAAELWDGLGCPQWAALSLARAPQLEAGRRALAILDDLDAPAVRAAVVRDRLAAGLPVPRGPRASTAVDPAGLTAREQEVLVLLGDGLSNAQIADALVLSAKTVGHHVSAILAKLGEPSRSRAVAAGIRRGLIAGRPAD